MLELMVPITECQVDGPSSKEDDLRHIAERKTRVSCESSHTVRETPSVRVE